MGIAAGLAAELEQRRAAHLYRTRRTLTSPQGPEVVVDGRPMLGFCSNDYLGLAADPRLAAAMGRGMREYGTGSGAAHLVTGHSAPHEALERDLAEFLERPRALLFSTGYMANLGVMSALLGPGDTLWEDRLSHASLIDGGLLCRARFHRYAHGDVAGLARRLTASPAGRRLLVASDGVFSMDGDLAPLPGLARAVAAAGGWLLVDDAHGIGVLGAEGRGTLEHFGLGLEQVPILVGTLGKALGTFGAFVAGEEELIETLIQRARSFIYTTAPPPALALATREALRILRAEPWRRVYLGELVARFRAGCAALGLPLMSSTTPIQPLVAGDAVRALAWSRHLEGEGMLIPAIRPPTVPEGSARLRVTLSAAHSAAQVDRLLAGLATLPCGGLGDAA
jgi:8-amino-7-oxononanoate synthase